MAKLDILVDVKGASQLTSLDKQLKTTETSTQKVTKSFNTMGVALGAVVGSQAIRGLVNYADTWTSIENKLKLVTSNTADLIVTQEKLFRVAENSRQSYEATATLYSRMARASKDLGTSQEDLLTVTETINKALAVSGATAQESASTVTQLSQAMASGVLRGEEYNSIAENGARINEIFAKSLDVTNGELREMAKEGKITTEVMMKALLEETANVNAEFEKMNLTIGQALQSFDNNLGSVIDRASTATGVMSNLAVSIKWVGEAINEADQYWFGDPTLTAYAERIKLDAEWGEKQKEIRGITESRVDTSNALLDIFRDLAQEEREHNLLVAESAWKTQELADHEAQLKAEYDATNNSIIQDTLVTEANTQAKQQATIATVQLAQANATGTYSSESWLYDSNGNLKSSGGSQEFYGSTGAYGGSTNPLASFNNSVKRTEVSFNALDNGMSSFSSAMSSATSGLLAISNTLGITYESSARQALFGSSSVTGGMSFASAKASASGAWSQFQTDTSSQDFLNNYNDKMDTLIGTLEEFSDSSKYNSKAEQDFAKHKALREVQDFDKAQLDEKDKVDAQLAVLESIDDKTKENASTSRNQWVTKSEEPAYQTYQEYDWNGEKWDMMTKKRFVGMRNTYGWTNATGDDQGYRSGGYTGDGAVNNVAGVVHGQEYVVNAQTTKDLGLNNGNGGVFTEMNAHLYEINKTVKRSYQIERQVLTNITEAMA